MGGSVDPLPPLGLLGGLPWRTKVGDRRAVRKLLIAAGIDPRGALGGELLPVFSQRVSDCRDLFVLRGVRARRRSVLQMAGRALASDADQIAGLGAVTNGLAGALLGSLSDMIEVQAGHPARARFAPVVPVAPALAPAPPRTGPRQALERRRAADRERYERRSQARPRTTCGSDIVIWTVARREDQRLAA